MLKAADMLQAEGLLRHCLEAFRGGLTVHTAIEHLVWAHKHGPEEARGLAMAYVVQHIKTIQVRQTVGLGSWRVLSACVRTTCACAPLCLRVPPIREERRRFTESKSTQRRGCLCAPGREMRGRRWASSRRCLQQC